MSSARKKDRSGSLSQSLIVVLFNASPRKALDWDPTKNICDQWQCKMSTAKKARGKKRTEHNCFPSRRKAIDVFNRLITARTSTKLAHNPRIRLCKSDGQIRRCTSGLYFKPETHFAVFMMREISLSPPPHTHTHTPPPPPPPLPPPPSPKKVILRIWKYSCWSYIRYLDWPFEAFRLLLPTISSFRL